LKILQDILYKVPLVKVVGSTAIPIHALHIDSRLVTEHTAFIAIKGSAVDGHVYIDKAIRMGATCIVCETLPAILHDAVTYVQTKSTHFAAGVIAHLFYDEPSSKMKLVGVTGTNGKTTVATLLYNLFTQLGYTCGLLSTVQNHIGATILTATHTTPDAISINALLHQMVAANCAFVFMEVSSHAIHQQRIAGLQFAGGIFTNITHDHLDYHKDFDEYIRVKKAFFDGLSKEAFAITNLDDKRGNVMLQNCNAQLFTYSLQTLASFKGKILENALTGLQLSINNKEVHFRLIGEFNAYNLLAVYGAAICLHEKEETVLEVLSNTTGAEGRFDYFISAKEHIIGIIDYAHTPDALQNVLATIQKLNQDKQQIISVIGCGGNRDKTKRPLMAAVACAYSDKVIFTADNPREEDPMDIINDMETDLKSAYKRKYVAIVDRREAIKTAVNFCQEGDIILVAGKGHEKYQEIKGIKKEFDDKKVLQEVFALLEK
jgi:UDP-N-acetylmuramoyl-L-alanyl-D-glutamate--2,6-diaminopimelate ligase